MSSTVKAKQGTNADILQDQEVAGGPQQVTRHSTCDKGDVSAAQDKSSNVRAKTIANAVTKVSLTGLATNRHPHTADHYTKCARLVEKSSMMFRPPTDTPSTRRQTVKERVKGTTGNGIIDAFAWLLYKQVVANPMFCTIREQLGDWETWVQSNLMMTILQHLTENSSGVHEYHILKDQCIHRLDEKGELTGRGTCDFTVESTNGTSGVTTMLLVNCKVEYRRRLVKLADNKITIETNPRLAPRFMADMAKMSGGLNERAVEAFGSRRVRRLCVGLTRFHDDLQSARWKMPRSWTGPPWQDQQVNYLQIIGDTDVKSKHKHQSGLWLLWWTPSVQADARDSAGLGMTNTSAAMIKAKM